MMTVRYSDADRAAVRARVPIESLAPNYVARWRKRGREYVGLCPFHRERTPSFTVVPAKRFFMCFGCGAHGDVIRFYQEIEGVSYAEAMARLLERGGLTSEAALARAREHAGRAEARARVEDERDRRERRSAAEELWARTRSGLWTIVETYLREARGIDLDLLGGLPADLRFLPAQDHWDDDGVVTEAVPCMAAAIRDIGGALLAVHLTFLKPDGSGKAALSPAKKIKGPGWGGHIDLGPVPGSSPRTNLAVGEGIETCLSWRQLRLEARRPEMAVWAAASLGNLCGAGMGKGLRRTPDDPRRDPERRATWRLPSAIPDSERPGIVLPIGVQDLHLLRERGGRDAAAYAQLFERARARHSAGHRVWVEDPGAGDHNDLLMARRAA